MHESRSIDAKDLGLGGSRTFVVWGELPPHLERRRGLLAVIGSRAAMRTLCERARATVEAAGELGLGVVSGGALGIDGAAHRHALRLGVPQLLVHPCGPDNLYPPTHVDLIHAVAGARHSGVLFAVPEGTPPKRGLFASRNAIVVGLSEAVVVAQAAQRSGTMSSARMALRRGLAVGTFDASPGARALVGEGAVLLSLTGSLVTGLQQLLGQMPPPAEGAPSDPVLRHLDTPKTLDSLCAAAPGQGPLEIMQRLAQLRAQGLVIEVSPGCYARSRPAG